MTTQERIDKMLKKSEAILNAGKQTNEEWLKSLNTEQLAIWLCEVAFYSHITDEWENKSLIEDIPTADAIAEWLKEKHNAE